MCLAQGPQRSDAGEARTRDPLVSSQALYSTEPLRSLCAPLVEDIEDIYFFEMNTKCISSSVLKSSEFSRVRSMSENSDVLIHEINTK